MLFARKGKVWIGVAITALLMVAIIPGESRATNGINSFAGLEACVADANETECVISDDFEFTGELPIARNLTIKGDATLTRASGYEGSLFSIADGVDLTLDGLTIDGGAPGWEKDLTPENIPFRFNGAGDRVYGGYNLIVEDGNILANAPVISNLGNLTINNSTFQNSYNNGSTASVIENRGSLTIADSTFQHNVARANSTIHNYDKASFSVSGSTFIDNNAGIGVTGTNGGAIVSEYGPITVTGSYFENNAAVNDGGAINSLSGDLEISDSAFIRNSSGNDGSAIKLGRGVTASSAPRDEQSAAVLSDLVFSENINLSTYWNDGDLSPKGIAVSGNGQGVVAYFNDGYEDLTIKDSSFSGDTTGWGVISLYSCDSGVDPSLCATPNYLVDGVNIHDEDGSLISASARGNLTIKNSTLEPNRTYAIAAYNMLDVTIEDTTIVGGLMSMRMHDNETTCLDGLTIDGADLAFYVYNTPEVEIDGLTVKNSHHESYSDHYVGALFGANNATVSNVDYSDNAGKIRFSNIDDLTIADSHFCSTKRQALEIGGASGETNATITNTTVCRDNTDGPAMTVLNYGDDESISRDVNLVLGDGFEITGNTNNGNPDDPDSLSGGYGGGIYIEAYDDVNLTITEGAVIDNNFASNAGNDVFVRSMNDDTEVTIINYGNLVEDNADNRATESSEPAMRLYVVQGGGTLGLSHPIKQEEPADADDGLNPETFDPLLSCAVLFAATSLCGIVIFARVSRR